MNDWTKTKCERRKANPLSTYLYYHPVSPSADVPEGFCAPAELCLESSLLSCFGHLLVWLATYLNLNKYDRDCLLAIFSITISITAMRSLTNRHHPGWRCAERHPWRSPTRLPCKGYRDPRQPRTKSVPSREPKWLIMHFNTVLRTHVL